MSLRHIMLDCESLGLRNDALILTIGAVEFDPYSTKVGATFHRAIDPVSAQQYGLSIDADTTLFWLQQEDAAQRALLAKLRDASPLPVVLHALSEWLRVYGTKDEVKLWTCGHKDIVWLESAYAAVKQPVPFGYRTGDFRTIRDQFARIPEDTPAAGISHDALSDALFQAEMLQNIFSRMGVKA